MALTPREKYKQRLQELQASPKRSLGQNFLIEMVVIERIIEAAGQFSVNNLIEIGPGLGALTESLDEMADDLTLIELDKEFSEMWRQQGMNLIEKDALRLDWEELVGGKETLLVSNLPYQISSSIVMDRSVGPDSILGCVFMFQKEVAERIMAPQGSKQYGLLSVMAQSFWDIHKVVDAGPGCFYPAPKVSSRVLSFRRKKPEAYLETQSQRKSFLKYLKAGFAQRRKFLIKNLLALGIDRPTLEKEFKVLDIDVKARAEELSVSQWQQLFYQLLGS